MEKEREEAAAARGRAAWPGPPGLERQSLRAVRLGRAGAPGRRVAGGGRVPLHRLLVAARLGEGVAAQAVAGYHRELFENAIEDPSREPVSGLLLLCPSSVCHVVESCSSTIHLIIQELASLQTQGHGALLQEIKVLVVAHNIPTRLFPDWNVAAAPSPVTRPSSLTQPQPTAEVVAECLALLLRLADCIEEDNEDTHDNVHTLAPELPIPEETINELCNAEECLSPEDFVRIYLSPSQPALDSETVWPVPSHLPA